MADMRRHRIPTVDVTVEFVGKEQVNKTAAIRLHKRKRAKLTVTVYRIFDSEARRPMVNALDVVSVSP